jgi:hypothetical protein
MSSLVPCFRLGPDQFTKLSVELSVNAAYLGAPTTMWKTRGESLEDCLDLAIPITCDRKSPLGSTLPANTSRICSSTVPSPSFEATSSLISLTTSPAGTLNLCQAVETDAHVSCFIHVNGTAEGYMGALGHMMISPFKKIQSALARHEEGYRILDSNKVKRDTGSLIQTRGIPDP